MVDFVAFFEGDEEDFARRRCPMCSRRSVRGEEDVAGRRGRWCRRAWRWSGRRRGETSAAEVEGDGGAVGLVAVEEDCVVAGDGVGGFEVLDGFGEVLRGEHGGEADEGDVGGDEEDG